MSVSLAQLATDWLHAKKAGCWQSLSKMEHNFQTPAVLKRLCCEWISMDSE